MKYGKYLPYIVAIAAFIAVSMAYFAPQFSGQTLRQTDVVQYNGMTQDILEHREKYDEDPQWAGNVFGGMPAYLINMKQDGMLIRQAGKALNFLGEPASMIFIAMLCFYFMLLCFGINPWVAIMPALAYGLSTYFFVIIGAGHITKMRVLAFIPMLVGGVYYAYHKNMWIGAALAGIFASLAITHNHIQITYYFLFIILALVINEFVRAWKEKMLPRFAKTTAVLALAAALAAGSNFSLLYYIQHHAPETIRGGSELAESSAIDKGLDLEYATRWSYGIGETLNLLVPDMYGGTTEGGFSPDGEVAQALTPYGARNIATQLPAYWGDQPGTSGPVYIGAVVIFIAVLGLFLLKRRKTLWISIVAAIAIMLAWGHNFMWFTELFYNYFPLYNKFRTISMILVIVEWCTPFLAALTLQKLWCGEVDRKRFFRGLKYATGIVGGVILLILIFSSGFSFSGPVDLRMAENMPQEVMAAMRRERASMLQADCIRSLLFVLATAAVIWFFYAGKIKKWTLITLLVILVAWDMIPVNLRYMGRDRFVSKSQAVMRPTEADRLILQDTTLGFRVINLTVDPFSDGTTSYFHRSLGGYHAAKLARYQDLIERQLARNNMEAYNMLNTLYFIMSDETSGQPQALLNPDANGAAWLVEDIMTVDGANAEMSALNIINTKTTAVVDERFTAQLPAKTFTVDSTARIDITDYRANYQKYDYYSPEESVAVFSEIYYPKGWTAYIDGVEASYFRADYVLRAMALPAGEHTVEFRFKAPKYNGLTSINLICSAILLAGTAGSVVYVIMRKKRKEDGSGGE